MKRIPFSKYLMMAWVFPSAIALSGLSVQAEEASPPAAVAPAPASAPRPPEPVAPAPEAVAPAPAALTPAQAPVATAPSSELHPKRHILFSGFYGGKTLTISDDLVVGEAKGQKFWGAKIAVIAPSPLNSPSVERVAVGVKYLKLNYEDTDVNGANYSIEANPVMLSFDIWKEWLDHGFKPGMSLGLGWTTAGKVVIETREAKGNTMAANAGLSLGWGIGPVSIVAEGGYLLLMWLPKLLKFKDVGVDATVNYGGLYATAGLQLTL